MIPPVAPFPRLRSPRWMLARILSIPLALASCGLWAAPQPARAQNSAPFAPRLHALRGGIHQIWPLSVSHCPNGGSDLLVLHSDGAPPQTRKWLTWMPCGSALRPDDPSIVERLLPDDAVVVDVASLPGRNGPQLVIASAAGLRIQSLGERDAAIAVPIPGGLPLPPRPWEIGRLELVDDWNDNGRPSVLVPALDGAWLVELPSADVRRIPLPVYASYRTWNPFLPVTVWKWMIQEVTWPTIARADDNGDGRLDLFALSRWAIWIYHSGPDGLPSEPSRKLTLQPFDAETERRHESTINNYFALDMNGDTLADLMLSTIGGSLMDGRSTSRVHLNSGSGVSPDAEPDARRDREGGFSGFIFRDLDGDGREELIETSIEFGIVQMIRVLITRRAETTVRVLRIDPEAENGLRTVFEDQFAFRLDFGEGATSDLVPGLGDWNGDGVSDLYVARGSKEISFRLGSRTAGEPLFGSATGRQPIPIPSGESRVSDLDGDGLDEIIAFTDNDPEQPLVVLENLGRLPGTRPELRAPPD